MANDGEWGTNDEITVAATLLRTPIAVYSAYDPATTQEEYGASSSSAAESTPSHEYFMIYLKLTNHHFVPVVAI